jgi:hypothetical protein
MKTILLTLFGWPGGILLGNLIANVVWVPLQWAGIHLRLQAHLRDLVELLDDCPNCGHRRSAADLLPSMPASSIVVASKNTEP